MVDFSLSEAQLDLRESVRKFCAARWGTDVVRAVEHGNDGRYDARSFADIAAMGLLGLGIPTAYGGEGASWLDRVIAHEELGRFLFLSPHYVSAVVSAKLLLEWATPDVCERLLPRIGTGEAIVTYAIASGSGSPAGLPATSSSRPAEVRVTGEEMTAQLWAVPYAAIATHYLVVVPGGQGFELLLVERERATVSCDRLITMAGAPLYDVTIAPSPTEKVSARALSAADIDRLLTECRLLLAAEALGAAKAASELAVRYASEREAFGQRIGSFQALQHKLADMTTRIQLADDAIYYAARVADEGQRSIAPTALAILSAAEMYTYVARNAVQIHGASGVMADSDVSLHFRRCRMITADIGDRRWLEKVIADDLLSESAPGIPGELVNAPGEAADRDPAGTDDSDLDALRAEFRAYFRRIVTPEVRAAITASNDDYSDLLYRALADAGYLGLAVPREYGGRALSYAALAVFEEEAALAGIPHGVMSVFSSSAHFAASLLARLGTDDQRSRYLPCLLSGEYRFTQGFTEPEGGSDLAAARTRANFIDGEFQLTGQKVFNTAHLCTHMIAVVRTNPDVPKHQGISLVLVDLSAPGVTILPLYTMRGWRRNLVIFEQARVPARDLVGELDRGWYAVMSVMDVERSSMRVPAERWRVFAELLDELRRRPDGRLRIVQSEGDSAAIARMYRDSLLGWLLSRHVVWLQDQGQDVTGLASFAKLFNGEAVESFVDGAFELLGASAATEGLASSAPAEATLGSVLADLYKDSRNWQIAGGSSEIQRNIIARRVLKLPSP
jgi:alkylation response protein AidB-like acyl-CoA dehydrogenase